MTQKHKIQLFEDNKVRTTWDDELQEWFFSAQSEKASEMEAFSRLSVGVLGLEPRMTGPESVVLPLHHTPMSLARGTLSSIAGAKVLLFPELPKLFGENL